MNSDEEDNAWGPKVPEETPCDDKQPATSQLEDSERPGERFIARRTAKTSETTDWRSEQHQRLTEQKSDTKQRPNDVGKANQKQSKYRPYKSSSNPQYYKSTSTANDKSSPNTNKFYPKSQTAYDERQNIQKQEKEKEYPNKDVSVPKNSPKQKSPAVYEKPPRFQRPNLKLPEEQESYDLRPEKPNRPQQQQSDKLKQQQSHQIFPQWPQVPPQRSQVPPQRSQVPPQRSQVPPQRSRQVPPQRSRQVPPQQSREVLPQRPRQPPPQRPRQVPPQRPRQVPPQRSQQALPQRSHQGPPQRSHQGPPQQSHQLQQQKKSFQESYELPRQPFRLHQEKVTTEQSGHETTKQPLNKQQWRDGNKQVRLKTNQSDTTKQGQQWVRYQNYLPQQCENYEYYTSDDRLKYQQFWMIESHENQLYWSQQVHQIQCWTEEYIHIKRCWFPQIPLDYSLQVSNIQDSLQSLSFEGESVESSLSSQPGGRLPLYSRRGSLSRMSSIREEAASMLQINEHYNRACTTYFTDRIWVKEDIRPQPEFKYIHDSMLDFYKYFMEKDASMSKQRQVTDESCKPLESAFLEIPDDDPIPRKKERLATALKDLEDYKSQLQSYKSRLVEGIMSGHPTPSPANSAVDRDKIYQWILELTNPDTRENALLELSKKREVVPELAPMLWNSFGTIAALLQEIINIYPAINPATLNAHQSNRVCNALALLQCVASHPETRSQFLLAHVPLFLYPFLHTVSKTRPFEYLRLTSLGVIGALVKTDEQEVITFLLTTEIIPLCLRIMESGSELSKTVATFILQKILLDESGLNYICQTYDRFSHVAMILGKMVISLAKDPSARLLKHVVRCYLRLSDNSRAREALRQCLPDQLRDSTFNVCLQEDKSTKHWLSQLLNNLDTPCPTDPRVGISPLTSQQ